MIALTLLCAAVAAAGAVLTAIAHRRRAWPHRLVAAICTLLMVVACVATLIPGVWAAATAVPSPVRYSAAVALVVIGVCSLPGLARWLHPPASTLVFRPWCCECPPECSADPEICSTIACGWCMHGCPSTGKAACCSLTVVVQ